ncbi:MAG: GspH/FimT family pseudopilin [Pseudomonadota bacterium]
MLRFQLHNGVTLFDLLVGITVASVLLAVAIPSFQGLVLDARRTTRVNEFVTAVHLAKSEAHKQHANVVICKAPNAQNCESGATWGDGWIVFVNTDRDRPPRVDEGERILRRTAPLGHGSATANRDAFVFRAYGVSSTNGTLTFCDRRGSSAARAVIVSSTGRPRTSSRTASGGILECPPP